MDNRIRAAIASLADQAWTPIEYPHAVFDEDTGVWVSRAEVAEIGFTAFAAQRRADHVEGRLVVRRIPDLNAAAHRAGQDTLFDTWRFHAFFTTADPEARHRVRGQDPPRARGHRTGPRRPQGLRADAPAIRGVHRQRRVAGAGRD